MKQIETVLVHRVHLKRLLGHKVSMNDAFAHWSKNLARMWREKYGWDKK